MDKAVKARWMQFRLSSIAVLFVVVAVGLWIHRRYSAYQALDLVAKKAEFVRPQPESTGWQRLFDDSVFRIQHISFTRKPNVTDEDIVHVSRLRRLRRLSLAGTSVSKRSAHAIAKLSNLESLSLDGTSYDDEAIAQLSGLKNLKLLSLSNTKITDASLPHIATMLNLEQLHLHRTGVTAFGLESLASHPGLKCIGISRPSPGEFAQLGRIKSLEELRIGTRVFRRRQGSNGIEHLFGLPRLRLLNIDVAPSRVDHWSEFPALEKLVTKTERGFRMTDHATIKSIDITIPGQAKEDIVLQNLPQLEQLSVYVSYWSPIVVRISGVPKLKQLKTNWVSVTLNDAPSIEQLSLTGWSGGPHGTATFTLENPVPHLRNLELKDISTNVSTRSFLQSAK